MTLQRKTAHRSRLAARICACFLMILGLCAIGSSVHAASVPKFYAPNLNVPIPGLNFKDHPVIINSTTNVAKIPFLSAYIGAAYQYLVGISVLASAIMIVWGGFKYIVGSASGVEDGKGIIKDAIIGLILIFGAYSILAVLNPTSLTELKPLEVDLVGDPNQNAIYTSSITTQTPTETAPGPAVSTSNIDTSLSQNCPLNLPEATPAKPNAKKIAFSTQIGQFLTGDFSQRVNQVLNYTKTCDVKLGPCGTIAETAWTIAGFSPSTCNIASDGVCGRTYDVLKNLTKHRPYVPVNMSKLFGLNCNNDCATNKASPLYAKNANRPDCQNGGAAVQKARDMFSSEVEGYPDKYSDLLQPGDWFYVYSVNRDCAGTHSLLFVEWKDRVAGTAIVAGGQVGEAAKFSEACLKKACGQYRPIVNIIRPDADQIQN